MHTCAVEHYKGAFQNSHSLCTAKKNLPQASTKHTSATTMADNLYCMRGIQASTLSSELSMVHVLKGPENLTE